MDRYFEWLYLKEIGGLYILGGVIVVGLLYIAFVSLAQYIEKRKRKGKRRKKKEDENEMEGDKK